MITFIKLISLSFFINLIYFVIYLKLVKKNFNFYNYFLIFFFISLIFYIFINFFSIYILDELFISTTNKEIFFILYIFFFISFFLTSPPRYIDSPSYLIYEKIKKDKKTNKQNLSSYLKHKKVIEIRLKDLSNQGIIVIKKNNLTFKKKINLTIGLIFLIKKILNLKSEG